MPHVILDMPYQSSVHGTPRRRRNADVWFVRRSVPVSVRVVGSDEAPEMLYRRRTGGEVRESTCRIVDGRLHVPTNLDVRTWKTLLVDPALSGDEFRPAPNPTPIAALSEKFSMHSRRRTVADDFTETLSSDDERARAAAVEAGSRLLIVDDVVLTSNVEPVFIRKKGFSTTDLRLVRVDAPPSRLAALYETLEGVDSPRVPESHGVFGSGAWTPAIDPSLFERASILTRCIEGVFPSAGAWTAMIGNGRPGSSPVPDDLEEAVHDLRSIMRRLDGPDGGALKESADISDALRHFADEVRLAGPLHVVPERAHALRNLLTAAETAAEDFMPCGGPRP